MRSRENSEMIRFEKQILDIIDDIHRSHDIGNIELDESH